MHNQTKTHEETIQYDIYAVVKMKDTATLQASELRAYSAACEEGAFSINCALRVIGNLLLCVEGNEEYSDAEARNDLELVGVTLRNLPRMAQALQEEGEEAEYIRTHFRGGNRHG